MDSVEITSALMRCPSITPVDAGALGVLEGYLKKLGFSCTVLRFSGNGSDEVTNLYARLGTDSPNFCYAGHTDVVPVGDPKSWQYPPFDAVMENGVLHGRGAVDMKGAIGAFVSAVERYLRMLKSEGTKNSGSISLLITGDEEGAGINGTRKVLEWLKEKGEVLDHCLVGEPTNPDRVGEMLKIGRRGSLNAFIKLIGKQGHVAYPEKALNPVSRLANLLQEITNHKFDEGTPRFEPSNLEVTSVDVGNLATNVIPGEVTIRLNIRFNDNHTGSQLGSWLREVCQKHAGNHKLSVDISGEAFVTVEDGYTKLVRDSVKEVTGGSPVLSTSGGTSDARFIKDVCPVVEFGLISRTMHRTDECISIRELERLSDVYTAILRNYFSAGCQAR
ncbi:MAG: succinyl-diaminopimelate desuccinylase [Pseudomonadota bacterium]|nr:succinyl-diaminopimelate desuccinylase [Pseudomonadota bacterium]